MNTSHTQTPWNFHEQGDANDYCLLANEKRWVISFRQNGEMLRGEQLENAKFIVRAANNHDALLDQLKIMTDAYADLLKVHGQPHQWGQLTIENAREVIAQAEK